MTGSDITSDSKNSKIIFILTFTIILFFWEYLFRNFSSELSTKIVKKILKKGTTEHCHILSNLQFFEYDGRFLLLLIILNFTNTFSALTFVLLDSFSVYLNGVLKIIYLEPRPFWTHPDLYPCICATNYGNPSTTGMNQFIIFAVFYKAITTTYKNVDKFIFGAVCAVPVMLIYSSRYFQGVHSLNQLIFGCGIGFIIYYIYFEIINVNLEDKNHFHFLIKNSTKFITALLSLFLLATIFHLVTNLETNEKWLKVITKHCETIPYNLFDNESYRKTSKVFLFIGCLFGILLELKISFGNNNYSYFIWYNIHPKKNFSKTSFLISLSRLLIMFSIYFILNKLFLTGIGDPKHDSFAYLTIFGFIIPYLINGIIFFFLFKILVRFLNLTNEAYYKNKNKKEDNRSYNSLTDDSCIKSYLKSFSDCRSNNELVLIFKSESNLSSIDTDENVDQLDDYDNNFNNANNHLVLPQNYKEKLLN